MFGTMATLRWMIVSHVERYFACASKNVVSMIMSAIPTSSPIIAMFLVGASECVTFGYTKDNTLVLIHSAMH